MPNRTIRLLPLSSTLLFPPLPFWGAQSYEVFHFVKTRSILHSPLDGEGKGTKFLTFTSTASPRHQPSIYQRSCQTAQPTPPRHHPPFSFPRPSFGGAQSYEVFCLVKPLSRPYPERDDKVTDFLAFASPYSQRPLSPSRERKGTKLFALSSPSPYPPLTF